MIQCVKLMSTKIFELGVLLFDEYLMIV